MAISFPTNPATGDTTFTGGRSWMYDGERWSAVSFYADDFTMMLAVTDENSDLFTGTTKISFRSPFSFQIYKIPRIYVGTAGTGSVTTVDVKVSGTSIFGSGAKLTIDPGEKTSTTAATAAGPISLMNTVIADDSEITVDITTVSTGAKGLKLVLYLRRTS
ncbi:hypothetical protein UFOVP245_109 [uncultured Caudovirales phage]|uniref:Uncharacterized protein n=1 Tax=uncultured Caudovirales phage TaxID=2100421 RepID=A0A6J7WWJ7_9CAUD|nr:hypothetical protein UFOVP245_109 [uncultured Caudovirales phage]